MQDETAIIKAKEEYEKSMEEEKNRLEKLRREKEDQEKQQLFMKSA